MLHLPREMKRLVQAAMKRTLSIVALLFLLLVLLTETSVAAPLQQEQQCEITSPRPNSQVRGSVEIVGTARLGPQFQKYILEYASAATPSIWIQFGAENRQEKTNAGLEIWHTTALPDGDYLLRLTCAKVDGNYARTEPIPVRVANTQAAPTPTPEETPTPTPTVVFPTPTPAIVEQPAVIQRTPTATPLPGGEPSATEPPEPAGTISFPDVGVFVRQFVFGAFVTIVIFLFVGVVFLLKRLI